ncbi:MAG: carboxylesterase family protein, partial [Bacteroidales bacterium]|nr:carboxylesterase family protein [Bacteroidales bacterium]
MLKKITLLLCALAVAACTTKEAYNPVLTIEGGQIQGVAGDIEGVYVYKGIPYAAPPIGDLRWKAPQPVQPWDGVKLCDQFGHPAFQGAHYPGGYTDEWGYGEEKAYSEDCLYLNVYTKNPGETDKKLPVALWIFGGGLREGWGSEPEFEGSEWANKDVVLVTFNYRVGPFGFFAHPDLSAEDPEHATGNWGTLDQIAALKWVKNNIAQFGGDPDNVMIFGQSAGSRSVKFLSASPLTKGLFNKAVIMSGSGFVDPRKPAPAMPAMPGMPAGFRMPQQSGPVAVNGHYTLAQAEQSIKEVADWANLKDINALRRAGTETIYALGTIYTQVTGKRSVLSASPIAPYIDNYVLPETFDQACIDGSLADVPYMIGFTLHDSGNMAPQIADFALNREEMGGKAYTYQFARPLPDDGKHPAVTNRLKGAFHSSDLWFVF